MWHSLSLSPPFLSPLALGKEAETHGNTSKFPQRRGRRHQEKELVDAPPWTPCRPWVSSYRWQDALPSGLSRWTQDPGVRTEGWRVEMETGRRGGIREKRASWRPTLGRLCVAWRANRWQKRAVLHPSPQSWDCVAASLLPSMASTCAPPCTADEVSGDGCVWKLLETVACSTLFGLLISIRRFLGE